MNNRPLAFLIFAAFTSLLLFAALAQSMGVTVESRSTSHVGQTIKSQNTSSILLESLTSISPINSIAANTTSTSFYSTQTVPSQVTGYSASIEMYSAPQYPTPQYQTSICISGG